ncbi:MAG: AAA family ATPase, partial [Lentisphaeria bacterium]
KSDTFKKTTRANGYIDCLDGTANVKLMLNWFKKMAWADGQNEKHSPEFIAVKEAMEKCFSLMTEIEDVKVQFNPETSEIDIIYMSTDSKKMKISLNQLSDGYKGTIGLIADIAYRMAILNPQLLENVLTETTGIILIDEVDLHLHPAWQKRVILDLTSIFPKVQFVVTTHAPAVINSVKSENLRILSNSKIVTLNNEVYGKDVNSVLNEIMGVTSRPTPISKIFSQFYENLNEKKFDLAESDLNKIAEIRGEHDNEVAGCRVKLKLERIRGGKG